MIDLKLVLLIIAISFAVNILTLFLFKRGPRGTNGLQGMPGPMGMRGECKCNQETV